MRKSPRRIRTSVHRALRRRQYRRRYSVAEACEAAEGLATALINAGTPVESRALAYFGDVTDRVRMLLAA